MFTRVRQALLWMHRIIGIGFSGLLLIAFFMGSLAVYDRELDSWMLPQIRWHRLTPHCHWTSEWSPTLPA